MAVTQKKAEELNQYPQQQTKYPSKGYQGLAGVSDQTAQQVQNAQKAYQPSQEAQQAQQQLQQVQAQRPASYNSKYGAQLDNILQQIQNPKEFKYSFDGDEMFKYYADLYSQNGRQASMDAMGQAAALTGGYGNSYAQQVGNQAYDEWMRNLYDRGMDLYDRAYQRYRDNLGDQKDAYNMLSQQDQIDYGRYRDTVGDWEGDRDYWTNRTDTLDERGYNRYMDNLDYYTKLAQVENADYRSEQERQEAIRQFNMNYDRSVYENDRDYDRGVLESDRAFEEQVKRADQDEAYRNAYFNWQQGTDQRDYDRSVLESDRAFQEDVRRYGLDYALQQRGMDLEENQFNWQKETDARDFAEQQLRADQDEAYRQAYFNWQQGTDTRDYNRNVLESDRNYDRSVMESDRNYNRSVLESDRNYNRSVLESDRAFAEQQYQFDAQMKENIRQFNESLNWDKMSSDQKYAAQYALAILQNGQMPSAELLQAAGLSAADAKKLMAQIQPVSSGSGSGNGGKKGSGEGNTYYSDTYGNYWTFDKSGNPVQVDKSTIKKTDQIDPSLANLSYNLGNKIQDTAKTVSDQWNNSQLKQDLETGWNNFVESIQPANIVNTLRKATEVKGTAVSDMEDWQKDNLKNLVNNDNISTETKKKLLKNIKQTK